MRKQTGWVLAVAAMAAVTACSSESGGLTEQIESLPAIPETPLQEGGHDPAFISVITSDLERVEEITGIDRPDSGSSQPWDEAGADWYNEVWGPEGLGLEAPGAQVFDRAELAHGSESHDQYAATFGLDERDADRVTTIRTLGMGGFSTSLLEGDDVVDLFTEHADDEQDGIHTADDGSVSGMEVGDGILLQEASTPEESAEVLQKYQDTEGSLADFDEGLTTVAEAIDEDDWYIAAVSRPTPCGEGSHAPGCSSDLDYFLEPYQWLGLSSDYEDGTHTHRAVLLHDDAETAEANAELVEQILEEETAHTHRRAYDALELTESEVDGELLRLSFERSNDDYNVPWVYNLVYGGYSLLNYSEG
ncbi:hypothetical protein HGQ17_06795 [Nesterenkonia sp. MY13]|uniref:Uncharacterized protein n=1 Tax=Nesterenkonia sedimenti TaxID=1463632 RepID=A0A7X8TJ58_9MICC|nr:hypothetical protein [Nesterenkonia sedimenti]NLS09717.1 hypothetical protein [Nesterenkonia sedimenti]